MYRLVLAVTLLTSALGVRAAGLAVDFQIGHRGECLRAESLRYAGGNGESYSVTRLDWLATGFALERADGSQLELPGSVFVSLTRPCDGLRVFNLPSGDYRALVYYVGPDAETNHGDPARHPAGDALNPAVNGLHWSWQGGYIFLALEGLWRSASGALQGYALHFARDANRLRVRLPVTLTLARDTQLLIDLDVNALLCGERPIVFERDGASSHARDGDPLAASLGQNLAGAFRLVAIDDGTLSPPMHAAAPIDLPAMAEPYALHLSRVLPLPILPADNPLLTARVALGERLFSDPRLSRDDTLSCVSCHRPENAFSDPRRRSLGVNGQVGTRNAMPLFNLAWKERFFWDGRASTLREQIVMPMRDHLEMDQEPVQAAEKLRNDPVMVTAFAQAFGSGAISSETIALALENYLLTLVSQDSAFDRAMQESKMLSAQAERGMELFFTEYEPRSGRYGADCFHCHGGAFFTDHGFHDNGLVAGDDLGLGGVSGRESDRNKFATPSLRNVAITAPYMHDGRFETLEEVVAHYAGGVQRRETLDPNLAKHAGSGVPLSADDQAALVAFLKTLTGVFPLP